MLILHVCWVVSLMKETLRNKPKTFVNVNRHVTINFAPWFLWTRVGSEMAQQYMQSEKSSGTCALDLQSVWLIIWSQTRRHYLGHILLCLDLFEQFIQYNRHKDHELRQFLVDRQTIILDGSVYLTQPKDRLAR